MVSHMRRWFIFFRETPHLLQTTSPTPHKHHYLHHDVRHQRASSIRDGRTSHAYHEIPNLFYLFSSSTVLHMYEILLTEPACVTTYDLTINLLLQFRKFVVSRSINILCPYYEDHGHARDLLFHSSHLPFRRELGHWEGQMWSRWGWTTYSRIIVKLKGKNCGRSLYDPPILFTNYTWCKHCQVINLPFKISKTYLTT